METMAQINMGCACCKCQRKKYSFRSELNRFITANRIVIFTIKDCPYSTEAKRLLDTIGVGYCEVPLDDLAPTDGLIRALIHHTGIRTIPQIFVDGIFLGGLEDLQQVYQCGSLQDRFVRANVVHTNPSRWFFDFPIRPNWGNIYAHRPIDGEKIEMTDSLYIMVDPNVKWERGRRVSEFQFDRKSSTILEGYATNTPKVHQDDCKSCGKR